MLRRLPAGSLFLVYETTPKAGEAPFPFIDLEGDTPVLEMPRGRRIFRSTCLLMRVASDLPREGRDLQHGTSIDEMDEEELEPPRVLAATMRNEDAKTVCGSSRRRELEELIQNGPLRHVKKGEIADATRSFGSRFIDALQEVGQEESKKSRLVDQNVSDQDATRLSTRAATVQRFLQRFIASLNASLTDIIAFIRDVTQA